MSNLHRDMGSIMKYIGGGFSLSRVHTALLGMAVGAALAAEPHPRSGTESFPRLSLTEYARPAGMGQAYTGLADGVDAIGINPSGLVHQEENHGVVAGFERWILETNKGFVTYHSKWQGNYYATSLSYLDEGGIQVSDIDGSGDRILTDQTINPYSLTAMATGARIVGPVNLGLTFKMPVDYLGDTEYAQWALGWGFDAGVQYQPNTKLFTFGASLLNLGRQERAHMEDGDAGQWLPMEARVGMVYHGFARSKGRIVVDLNAPYHDYAYLSGGGEYNFSKSFAVRGGSQVNFKEMDYYFRDFVLGEKVNAPEGVRTIKLTGGLTLNFKGIKLEYAGQYWSNLGILSIVTVRVGM